MVYCWATCCSHDNLREKCNFFSFPKDDETRNRWIQLTRTSSPGPGAFLCSCHFEDGKKENDPTLFINNTEKQLKLSAYERDTEENLDGDAADLCFSGSCEVESNITCVVPGCANTSMEGCVEFFPFPQSKMTRYKWLQFCGSDAVGVDTMKAHICSDHFEESSYITEIKNVGNVTCLIRALDVKAVPIIKHPNSSKDSVKLKEDHQLEHVQNMNVDELNIMLDTTTYGHIKTQADLLKLKICNQMLKKKNYVGKLALKADQTSLKQKEAILASLESKVSKRKILYEDVLAKVFTKSQIKLLCGHRRTHWTEDDLAVGFTIRYLSNRVFYNYLTNTLNFPLPGLSSIQRYITLNKKKSGNSSRSLLKDKV